MPEMYQIVKTMIFYTLFSNINSYITLLRNVPNWNDNSPV